MFRGRLAVAFAAAMVLMISHVSALAVEGEPAPPELCTLEPRTIDSISAIASGPVLPPFTREPLEDPFEVPDGDEVDTDTRLEVKKDLRRAIGCINTGSLLSSLATFTDTYVQQLIFSEGGELTEDLITTLEATETRDPEDYVTIIDYQEMVILPDDRVFAVVYGDDPLDETPPSYTVFYLVEVERGRWLIDDFLTVERPDPQEAADEGAEGREEEDAD